MIPTIMLNLPDFNEMYDSYIHGHKIYTYDELIRKYSDMKHNSYMFIPGDRHKDEFVIGEEYENRSLWFTTKNVLQTIKINNMDKGDVLYVAKVELCKNAYFNRSPRHIITTNKVIIREIKQVSVVKKRIVFN